MQMEGLSKGKDFNAQLRYYIKAFFPSTMRDSIFPTKIGSTTAVDNISYASVAFYTLDHFCDGLGRQPGVNMRSVPRILGSSRTGRG